MSSPPAKHGLPQDLAPTSLTWAELQEHLAALARSEVAVYVRTTGPGTTKGSYSHALGVLAVLDAANGDEASFRIETGAEWEGPGHLGFSRADLRSATLQTAEGDQRFALCIQLADLTIAVFDTERLVRKRAAHGLPFEARLTALTWSEMRGHLAAIVRSGYPIRVKTTGAQTVSGNHITATGILYELAPTNTEEPCFWVGERHSLEAGGGFGFNRADFRGASLSTHDDDDYFFLGIDLVNMTIVVSDTNSP